MTLLAAWFGNPTPCSAVSLNWPSTCVAPDPQESACWKKGNVGSRCSAGRRWRVNSPRISPVGQPVRVKSQVRTGLPAGGRWIRTLGPSHGSESQSRHRFDSMGPSFAGPIIRIRLSSAGEPSVPANLVRRGLARVYSACSGAIADEPYPRRFDDMGRVQKPEISRRNIDRLLSLH
jgi:hypothetical protein